MALTESSIAGYTRKAEPTTVVNQTFVAADTPVDYANLTPEQIAQIEALSSQVPVILKESKAGHKTTEFWLTIFTLILLNVNLIPMPDAYQGYASAVLVLVYAISRGLAKKGVPDAEPDKTAKSV